MPKGYSLHIGLNKVDPDHYGHPMELKGCTNDAKYYMSLAEQMPCEKITKLINTKATTAKVIYYIQKAAKTLESGDLFFLTYSGHGATLPDRNKDEKEIDKADLLDETWCLYDRQFLDDELFYELSQFKQGIRVLVISDSCHSGTVVHGKKKYHKMSTKELMQEMQSDMMQRSTDYPVFGDEEQKSAEEDVAHKVKDRQLIPLPEQVFERFLNRDLVMNIYKQNRKEYDAIMERTKSFPRAPSTFIMLMSACQDDETAKEEYGSGVFTSTLRDVLKDKKVDNYDDLFKEVRMRIPGFKNGNFYIRYQTPNLGCDGEHKYDFRKDRPFKI